MNGKVLLFFRAVPILLANLFFKFLKFMPLLREKGFTHESRLIKFHDGIIRDDGVYWPSNLRRWRWRNPYGGKAAGLIGKRNISGEADDFVNKIPKDRVE